MSAIPGKRARVLITARSSVAFTGEATSPDAGYEVYTIDDRDKRYWDRDMPVTVYRNAAAVDPAEYRIQPAGGRVHFLAAQDPGDEITVDGYYFPVSHVLGINEYTLTISSELVDISDLRPGRHFRDRLANLVEAAGTLSGFYLTDHNFKERLLEQERLALEFEPDSANGEFFGLFAFLDTSELTQAVEGAVETSVSFESDGFILLDQQP